MRMISTFTKFLPSYKKFLGEHIAIVARGFHISAGTDMNLMWKIKDLTEKIIFRARVDVYKLKENGGE